MFKFIRAALRKHAAKKVAKTVASKWRATADIIETPEAIRLLNRMLMVVSDNQEAVEKIIHEAMVTSADFSTMTRSASAWAAAIAARERWVD